MAGGFKTRFGSGVITRLILLVHDPQRGNLAFQMPLQMRADELVGFPALLIGRARGVSMRKQPHVMQRLRVHLGGAWRAALVARRAANGRVESMMRAGPLALRAIEKPRRPAGMRHCLK